MKNATHLLQTALRNLRIPTKIQTSVLSVSDKLDDSQIELSIA